MIYLDNSATTQIDEHVLEAMLSWLREDFGNASSTHTYGRKARVAVESAREEIASLINAHPAEIIFTSGGTESNNTVLKSCVFESALVDSIVTSATEHHAILYPTEEIQRTGIRTTILGVNQQGHISVDELEQYDSKLTLVSIMHANNETGIVHRLREIRNTIPNAYLHTDAVQSFGKIPFDVAELGVDFATFSAHKIHGPKGVGALFIKKGIDFKAHQQGGGQERNRRAGTEAVALIVGFQTAARIAHASMQHVAEHTRALTTSMRQQLINSIPNIRINTPEVESLPNILNVSFADADQIDGDAILQIMDMKGIACSNGSACVSGTMQPSHVLSAMGRADAEAKAAVRFSLSKYTTHAEVTTAVTTLAEIIESMR
ncbi:MAG: cysteine desulfurase [Candidatus Kapabacteria bacterium]|nr:cysteine desulfurase [Candidatus Kapabacteria bacterium]